MTEKHTYVTNHFHIKQVIKIPRIKQSDCARQQFHVYQQCMIFLTDSKSVFSLTIAFM